MADFFERSNMTQLAQELNRRSSDLNWEVAPGPIANTLCVCAWRRETSIGVEQFLVMMDGSGRWVMDVVYEDNDEQRPKLDLGLPRGASLGRVADETLSVIAQLDELTQEIVTGEGDGSAQRTSSSGSSEALSRTSSERRFSWLTLLAALPVLIALPIDFRLVVGGYLSLVSLIMSLTLLNRVDWSVRTGKWIAVGATIASIFMIQGHFTYLWNVLN